MPSFTRRFTSVATTAVVVLSTTGSAVVAHTADPEFPGDPVARVNTFIGTKDEGNTFPGASAPFGMTQVSPIGTHYSGWRYDDSEIKGFGHVFLSGAGCHEQGGLISTLPTTGTLGAGPRHDFNTTNPATFNHNNYAATNTHRGEVGEAGYYRTRLTEYGGIGVEATAATRATTERYTFQNRTHPNVFINVGQANAKNPVQASGLTVVDDHTVRGWVRNKGFCGGREYTTWFTTRFDQPFSSFGTWDPAGGALDRRAVSGGEGLHGGWLSFPGARQVTASTSISYVDARGADNNLQEEGLDESGSPLPFDTAREQAQDRWRRELNRIRVQGSPDETAVFTTSLYHVLLQPHTASDRDGRYRGFDDRIHVAKDWTYYQFFSLWDTYRTQNQLLAMLLPQRAQDIARSVLTIHEQGGWLPRWAYANYETNTMTGDPVTPFLVDLWRFGALNGHLDQAYRALTQNANGVPPPESQFSGRAGNPSFLSRKFVQHDSDFPEKGQDVDPHHGGSATLEYALADCALSIMAGALDKHSDAARFAERGRNWRALWDATVHDPDRGFTGFFRPRNKTGDWVQPYEPVSDVGFHEGTSWQYQWLTQQDVPGLVHAMGGREQTEKRLDTFFAYPRLVREPARTAREDWVIDPYDYYGQFRYNPNNEPDLHSPWMYSLIGKPSKTSAVVQAQQTLFTNAPDGVTGNDDLGTMSAWYVFSALGLYPVMPGTGRFMLNAPRFEHAVVEFPGGTALTISSRGAEDAQLRYIDETHIDGTTRDEIWINWDQLRIVGTIDHQLTRQPTDWGTAPGSAPASPCAGRP